ncbi:ROK family protein [Rubneribacter badeniensis]|uniref:ROK family protein n=1 Tax=Rubneribacter badeniensis TaxID=2070688 RepID=UPI0012FFE0FE|nr:ROK family protein [Rubneribacter badeniensis]
MRERIFNIVQRARPGDVVSHAYDVFIVAVAFLSIVPLMFRPQDMTPQMAAVMNMIDVVTVYLLFLDYILRWMTHDFKVGKAGKLGKGGWRVFARYPFTPLAIIDMLAILPSLGVLPESLKFLRVLRVTKMFRYSKNLTIVANVFRAQRNTLLSVLAVALMYIFVSGLVMFVNEPNTFDNFFDALYWATTALTTVGYGDVYPVTDLGKFISMASSLFGIAVIALPAGIITGGFLEQVRQRDEDAEAYFRASERDPFKGRTPFSYESVRAWAKAHPKAVAYGVTMLACALVNEALYFAALALGAPVWLDTVGTALAAVLLEPAAALIVGFANNLVLAVQFGNAGNLLYYALSAITALVYGTAFARGRRITARSLGWAALFLVVVEALISTVLTFSLAGGQLTTAAEQLYGSVLRGLGAPEAVAVFGALLVDKLADTVVVFAVAMGAVRLVVGSRLDPARWFSRPGAHAKGEESAEARAGADDEAGTGVGASSDAEASGGVCAEVRAFGDAGAGAGAGASGPAVGVASVVTARACEAGSAEAAGSTGSAGSAGVAGSASAAEGVGAVGAAAGIGASGTAGDSGVESAAVTATPSADAAGVATVSAAVAPECAERYVLGIDVGGTHTKAGVFDLAGSRVASHAFGSQSVLADGSHVRLSREMRALLDQAGIDGRSVVGVGLAVPGAVAAEESLTLCPHIDLDLRSYKSLLLELFPRARVAVLNDADAAVLGDRWRGTSHDRQCENVALVTLGTGVGAGVVVRGRLLSGVHGAAGEVGHLCVNPSEEERCSCGKAGCLEQYASATGLVRHARAALLAAGDVASSDQAADVFPDARAVLDAVERRDPHARAALERFSDALGFGLAQMACFADPDVFVLGGGLSERADLFIDAVRSRYRSCAVSACRDTPVVALSLGNECGVYGAAYRALQTLKDEGGLA